MEFVASGEAETRLRFQVGGDTDIGGGKENQDDFFIWQRQSEGVCIMAVLDGHGRDVGKLAAESGKKFLVSYFEERYMNIAADPLRMLAEAMDVCHTHIKNSFKEELTKNGWEVSEASEGYLLKRRNASQTWLCVHGGTSCSIAAIIGRKLYTANVGDSSAILCSSSPLLRPSSLKHMGDSALGGLTTEGFGNSPFSPGVIAEDALTDTIVVTAEHSPESVAEFERMRKFRCNEGDPKLPALHVVYDAPGQEKVRCPPVFSVAADGSATVTNNGAYYKNVRKEWASLVATPSSARFQDALAFTRSLGDLHLQSYGVSHLPEIHVVDLDLIFKSFISDANTANPEPLLLCLVLASDGVWDNWVYEDVTKFVMDASCLKAVYSSADGAMRVSKSFMSRNILFSKRNFGNQADNATGIVMYISDSLAFLE